MKKFEYMQFSPTMKKGIMSKSFDAKSLDNNLNQFGREGWELVTTIGLSGNAGVASWGSSTTGVVFIFKREV